MLLLVLLLLVSVQSANYDFYMTLEAGCCGTLQHVDMPTFRPSTTQVMAASTTTTAAAPCAKVDAKNRDGSEGGGADGKDLTTAMSALSLALSLGECTSGYSCV